MEVRANHKGFGSVSQYLPEDMTNPGYQFQSNRDNLALIGQYVHPQEWAELAKAVNASIQKHHFCNKAYVMVPFALTLAVCFCPMVYVACMMNPRVNADIEKTPVAEKLRDRGIGLYWEPKTKFDAGGLTFMIHRDAPQLPVQQTMRR